CPETPSTGADHLPHEPRIPESTKVHRGSNPDTDHAASTYHPVPCMHQRTPSSPPIRLLSERAVARPASSGHILPSTIPRDSRSHVQSRASSTLSIAGSPARM